MNNLLLTEKAKYFLFEVKRVPYPLVSYVEVGCMIENWMCLLVYLKYKFACICFCSWLLQLITQVLIVLVVRFCNQSHISWKFLGGGKLEYYKSMGGLQKAGTKFQILKFHWEETNTIFDSTLMGEKSWGKLWIFIFKNVLKCFIMVLFGHLVVFIAIFTSDFKWCSGICAHACMFDFSNWNFWCNFSLRRQGLHRI